MLDDQSISAMLGLAVLQWVIAWDTQVVVDEGGLAIAEER